MTRPLDEVRGDLRRLGYLDDRVERFLLQDALKPERPGRVILGLTAKVAGLVGVPVALGATLVLAAANGHLRQSPFDVLPLFLHLLPLVAAVLSVGFLALSVVFVALLRVSHVRRIEAASLAAAVLAAAIGVVSALAEGRHLVAILPRWQVVGLAILVPMLAWAVFHGVHGALLALAIRLTDRAPEQPFARGRWVVLALVATTLLVMVPAMLDAGRPAAEAPTVLPTTSAGRVLVVGVDGILPEEVDYLLASGDLPTLGRLADEGAMVAHRRGSEPPIALWASLATGLPSPLHGMDTVDTFRPAGVSRPLRRVGALRHVWAPLAPTALVEYRPVLANNRRVWAFWELASRGGAPSLVVGWWGTFPVEPLPGAMVAHGAHQLLAPRGAATDEASLAESTVYPLGRFADLAALARDASVPAGLAAGLDRVLGETADAVVESALLPDLFQRQAFRSLYAETNPRAAALYLPGLDIATDLAELGSVAQSELVRWQLVGVDTLLADVAVGVETVIVVFDPGRRGAPAGRTLLWRRGGCAGGDGETIDPEQVASAILRGLGLPKSRELPAPPAACPWPDPGIEVATYGVRRPTEPEVAGEEYLESLKALGYL